MEKTTRAYVKILETTVETTSRCERKGKEMRICTKDDYSRESKTSWRFIKIECI